MPEKDKLEYGKRLMLTSDESLHATAYSLALSVKTIRKAQRSNDPADFLVSTTEWQAAMEKFCRDVIAAIAESAASMAAEGDHVSRFGRHD